MCWKAAVKGSFIHISQLITVGLIKKITFRYPIRTFSSFAHLHYLPIARVSRNVTKDKNVVCIICQERSTNKISQPFIFIMVQWWHTANENTETVALQKNNEATLLHYSSAWISVNWQLHSYSENISCILHISIRECKYLPPSYTLRRWQNKKVYLPTKAKAWVSSLKIWEKVLVSKGITLKLQGHNSKRLLASSNTSHHQRNSVTNLSDDYVMIVSDDCWAAAETDPLTWVQQAQ